MAFLTVPQASKRFNVHPESLRRGLREGTIKGGKIGGQWRVADDALTINQPKPKIDRRLKTASQTQATQILAALQSGDLGRRRAAIFELAQTSQKVRDEVDALVEAQLEKQGEEGEFAPTDDFADWRALDTEPFLDGNGQPINGKPTNGQPTNGKTKRGAQ